MAMDQEFNWNSMQMTYNDYQSHTSIVEQRLLALKVDYRSECVIFCYYYLLAKSCDLFNKFLEFLYCYYYLHLIEQMPVIFHSFIILIMNF